LDEALSNIDKESREEIFEYLYSNDNLTIVSISHDDSVYKYSDFLWELNDDTINVINNNNKGGK
jgi:ABC-type bacteriocin/lantibiotic exporter with double-glycine peptidase domain